MIELQHHSSIFCNTAVQVPKDDVNLIEVIFDKASVRPRNIVLTRYKRYAARPHKVLDTYRGVRYVVRMVDATVRVQ